MASVVTSSSIDDITVPAAQQNGGAQSDTENTAQQNFRKSTPGDNISVDQNFDYFGIPEVSESTRVNSFPMFVECSGVFDDFNGEKTLLFAAPSTPEGNVVNVYDTCAYGMCDCIHMLEGVKSQLLPCRFAYLLFTGFIENVQPHILVYNSVCDGFKIVDRDVEGYICTNYSSILDVKSKAAMDVILARELNEGFISQVNVKPTCIHALGAVPKGADDIHPITDCSRPEGRAVNDNCTSLVKKFTYSSVQDVVELIEPGYFLSVVDIQAAYRAVPVYPAHRNYLGFQWCWEGENRYFVDNRLCFGLSTGPFYFHSISCFVAEIVTSVFGITLIYYLDDYIIIAPTFETALMGQKLTIVTLRYLGFHVSWKKISTPSTLTIYLGIQIDTIRMELSLPIVKVDKFKKYVNKYVTACYITKKELEQLNGLLAHCAQKVQGGKIFTRRCFDQHKVMVSQNRKRARISSGTRQDLEWWVCSPQDLMV